MINNEESTVYSQAIHYANRIVYMRVPLDCSKSFKNTGGYDDENKSNSNITARYDFILLIYERKFRGVRAKEVSVYISKEVLRLFSLSPLEIWTAKFFFLFIVTLPCLQKRYNIIGMKNVSDTCT